MNIENRITNYGTRNSINNLIIAHETTNSNSTIEGEVAYMKRNSSSAFVTHFVGGGGRIIQTAPVGKVSWGAGGRANPFAYAQVELCRTNDKATFEKDYAAYVWLLRYLAGNASIPKTLDTGSSAYDKGVKSHKWVADKLGGTDHQDPYGYLASWGISKEQFAKDISGGLGSATPAPSKPTLSGSYTVKKGDTLWGIANTHKSTVDSLKSLNGIKSDIITPGQVLKLSGTVAAKPTPAKPQVKYNLPKGVYRYRKNEPMRHGNDVLQIQLALSSIYFYPNKGGKNNGCDSWYGKDTSNAVKRFQSVNGLVADGDYGERTRAKLESLVNK